MSDTNMAGFDVKNCGGGSASIVGGGTAAGSGTACGGGGPAPKRSISRAIEISDAVSRLLESTAGAPYLVQVDTLIKALAEAALREIPGGMTFQSGDGRSTVTLDGNGGITVNAIGADLVVNTTGALTELTLTAN